MWVWFQRSPDRQSILTRITGLGAGKNRGGMLRSLLFFVAFYLYLWLFIDLRLIYHGGGVITNFPAFFRGWAFFRQFTLYPGGPVEYISAFLAQLFHYSWAGALVVTLQTWLIAVCTDCLLRAAGARLLRGIRFVPAILLLVLYNRYTYHFASTTALLTALVGAYLYVRVSSARKLLSVAAFVVLSVVLYYLAGGGYLLFAIICVTYELFRERRWQTGVLYLLAGLAIPYVEGVLVFKVSIVNAFSELLPLSWKTLGDREMVEAVWALYALVPLAALGVGLWRLFRTTNTHSEEQDDAKTGRKRKPAGLAARASLFVVGRPVFRWLAESLVLLAVATGAVFTTYDGRLKAEFEIACYASDGMWTRLLETARRQPVGPRVTNAVNRALYHTGRLGNDMFSYAQSPDVFLLTAEKYKWAYWYRFDARIELGLINMAENDLTECLELYGQRPIILKHLARVNMVKGNVGSARIYLGALSKTLFDADWAGEYLARLESDPNLSTDEAIQCLRRLRVDKDSSSVFSDNEEALQALLEKNSNNRMAFEYLMSWYLLTKQLDKLVGNIGRLNDLDYSEVPRLYEEALFVYAYRTKKPVRLSGNWGSPKSRERIEEFSRVYDRYERDKKAAFAELARGFGDSFFFYDVYGFSGAKN